MQDILGMAGFGKVRPQRRGALVAAAAAVLALGACTGTTDPSRAGFLDGLGNLATGAYDQRQVALQQTRVSTEAQAQQMAARAAALESERQVLAAEEATIRGRVQATNRQIDQQRRQLAALQQNQRVSRQQLAQAQARAAQLRQQQAQIANAPASPSQAQDVARLEREIQDLQGTIDRMIAAAAGGTL